MLKKNQLALILLTLVLMLTVYYITTPFDKDVDDKEDPIEETGGRIEELLALRAALRSERTTTVLSLDGIIADSAKTIAEKEAAVNEKRYINGLTEKELLLELEVINKGYRDCFVHATDLGVVVTIISDKPSLKFANEVFVMAMTKFTELDDVQIKWQTAEEVMGGVS